jgi:hypothetical protein
MNRHRSRWGRRVRRWLRRDSHKAAVALVLAILAVAVLSGHHSAASPSPSSTVTAGGGGAHTAQTWAAAFLSRIGEPQTACNLGAVAGWEVAEGGGVTNTARNNPLNTRQTEPGSHAINRARVQAFPTWAEGLQANATAITNGRYQPVLAALAAGDNAQAVADAVAASPWGTAWFPADCG